VRLAAVVALAAALACLAIVAAAVALDLGDLVLALASVFVLAYSAWFVLTRAGLRRLPGAVGALLGLTALIAFVSEHWLGFLAMVGVAALFAGAARHALGHERGTVRMVQPKGRPANAARRGVLIINPKSGGGKGERFNLPEEARKRGIEPVLLRPGTDLRELARQAVVAGADVIGMAGGDGSQAVVATVAMEHDVAHVCVPAGTLNHFALDLGLDRDDVVGALDAFADGLERRIDLASVNGRIFVNNASLGVYARVVQSNAYRDAKLRTWWRMLPEMLGPSATPLDLQFQGPDVSEWTDAALVLVSNNPYELRPLAGAATRPCLDTRRLGILAARVRSARDLARLTALGNAQRLRGLRQWSSREFEVRSRAPIAVGLDGEAWMLVPPLRFVSLPAALRVRLPQHAASVSPAGRVTLTRRDLAELSRLALRRTDPRQPMREGAEKPEAF
jgi:diacylglycerol kinase family enzyme